MPSWRLACRMKRIKGRVRAGSSWWYRRSRANGQAAAPPPHSTLQPRAHLLAGQVVIQLNLLFGDFMGVAAPAQKVKEGRGKA